MPFLENISEEVCCDFPKQLHVIIFPKIFAAYLHYRDKSKHGEQNWSKMSDKNDLTIWLKYFIDDVHVKGKSLDRAIFTAPLQRGVMKESTQTVYLIFTMAV